jgi:hypothetical protein
MFRKSLIVLFSLSLVYPQINVDKFKQLNEDITTPNTYRTASGYPGHDYWQPEADYVMKLKLDDKTQRLYGEETITFHNNSPDQLNYLWIQLDQNVRALDSDSYKIQSSGDFGAQRGREKVMLGEQIPLSTLKNYYRDFDGGFKIDHVKDAVNRDLPYIINKTMMRVDVPEPIRAGESYKFKIKWWYNINDHIRDGGRSGYEYFEEDDNYIYTIAQFFPRMCMYNDIYGWQNKQFLGRGEFTLIFGDYDVKITVPADHILGATGELQNSQQVLTREQIARLEEAKTADQPVKIVTNSEALENEKTHSLQTKTWHFKAENVRDYGFATSRKYLWDAIGVDLNGRTVMAMSYFPNEAEPLWGMYSTKAVAHTIDIYSKFTFDYPYPVAISAHINHMGMEYPMICFNGYRPEEDGTYSERTKKGLISVVIHEVGHNYFPMIVNSDERQWTWMDEGLNSFVQYLAEQEWDRDYSSRRGGASSIVNYMKGDKSNIMPIMTNSESIYQFGANAYGKPATALNILRETIMGRELFDFAFKEYSQTWMFKHPTPTDFFRIMENASAVDLDWFWRGWFFGNDHVDISLDSVDWYQLSSMNPEIEKELQKEEKGNSPEYIGRIRNETDVKETVTERDPAARDFYDNYDKDQVTDRDRREYEDFLADLSDEERELVSNNDNFYSVTFSDKGGLIMPIILELEYEDGEKEVIRIPVEIWRFNRGTVTKIFKTEKPVKNMTLDPFLETADTDRGNNYWPEKVEPTRFETFKQGGWDSGKNLMQRVLDDETKELDNETKELDNETKE